MSPEQRPLPIDEIIDWVENLERGIDKLLKEIGREEEVAKRSLGDAEEIDEIETKMVQFDEQIDEDVEALKNSLNELKEYHRDAVAMANEKGPRDFTDPHEEDTKEMDDPEDVAAQGVLIELKELFGGERGIRRLAKDLNRALKQEEEMLKQLVKDAREESEAESSLEDRREQLTKITMLQEVVQDMADSADNSALRQSSERIREKVDVLKSEEEHVIELEGESEEREEKDLAELEEEAEETAKEIKGIGEDEQILKEFVDMEKVSRRTPLEILASTVVSSADDRTFGETKAVKFKKGIENMASRALKNLDEARERAERIHRLEEEAAEDIYEAVEESGATFG